MIIFVFQCYSLKSSHPCLLPPSPKDCSIHLCLFCNLAYRVIITIFLNSIYMRCLLRNLYAGQEATVRTGRGTTDWFQIGKGVCQGCILSPYLFNLYAEYIMRNAGLEEAHLELRLPGEISITSDMQMTPPLWQKEKRN